MMNLHLDLNRLFAQNQENQAATVPVEMELNEQELAAVTGGWALGDGDYDDCCEYEDDEHHHHHHHHGHHHHH